METTLEELIGGLRVASADLLALLRCGPDVFALTPGGEWTVREAAVHLICGTRLYTMMVTGQPCPLRSASDLPAWNAGTFLALDEAHPTALADLADRAVGAFLAGTNDRQLDDVCPYYHDYGGRRTVGMLIAAQVYEYLLHGADIASAVGREWSCPEPAAEVVVAMLASELLAFRFVREAAGNLDATFAIESPGVRLCYQVCGGSLKRLDAEADTDCSVTGAAGRLLLWLSGRTGWEEATLSPSGRRPDLAPRFLGSLSRPLGA
jgi:uncharacterized protein (TIGR03083 family)